MYTNRPRRLTTGLSAVLIACVAASLLAGPVAAAPDPDKADQRAELKAERDAAKDERELLRAERKAERDAAKDERELLREERKAALEARKEAAKLMREAARAEIAILREGFSEKSVEERMVALEAIRDVREGHQEAFLALMEDWQAERDLLLPSTLSDTLEGSVADESDETEEEAEDELETEEEPVGDEDPEEG